MSRAGAGGEAPRTGFSRVLIANRGEIAVRVARACRTLGIEAVAVYSDADAQARHVKEATRAVSLGGQTAAESYLRSGALVEAALRTGCEAVHPGYGFLSENAGFASACAEAGLVFIGPRPETIELMGSKTGARAIMEAAGVPVIPGYQGSETGTERLLEEAERIGYPILVKAVYGGGGKGMRVVASPAELADAVGAAQREALKAFGRADVFLERFLERPRHVEVQVLGDGEGRALHFFERECSIQRRHQKIIEECPSPSIDEHTRLAICETGKRAAEAVRYLGAGTVEMIVDAQGRFYFLEMNTRLQVEHPVTELVCGVDLVAAQIRVAQGEGLPCTQGDVVPRGHAIECRIYAEDPSHGFLPSTGMLHRYREPAGPGIRVDSGVEEGAVVSPHYDPMLAKLIAWGAGREEAAARMREALSRYTVHGVQSNIGFLAEVLGTEAFAAADVHTRWIDEAYGDGAASSADEDAIWAGVALAELLPPEHALASQHGGGAGQAGAVDPFLALGGWRLDVRKATGAA